MTFPNLRFGLGFENGLFSFLQLYVVLDFDGLDLSLFISCIRSLSKVLVWPLTFFIVGRNDSRSSSKSVFSWSLRSTSFMNSLSLKMTRNNWSFRSCWKRVTVSCRKTSCGCFVVWFWASDFEPVVGYCEARLPWNEDTVVLALSLSSRASFWARWLPKTLDVRSEATPASTGIVDGDPKSEAGTHWLARFSAVKNFSAVGVGFSFRFLPSVSALPSWLVCLVALGVW